MSLDTTQKHLFNIIGEFKSSETEVRYSEKYNSQIRNRLIFTCIFTSIAYFLGIIANTYVLESSTSVRIMFLLRLLCLILGFASAAAAWKKNLSPYLYRTMISYMTMVGVSESVEAVYLFNSSQGVVVPTAPIIVLMYYLFISIKFTVSFVPSIAMTIMYSVTLLFFTESPLPNTITIILFFSLANLYGCYHVITFNRVRRSEFYAVIEQQRLNCSLKKEINKRKDAENKLIKLSTIDDLTGIFNRRHFLELFERERKISVRYKHPLSLLIIDADHFKRVNDTYGHDTGDIVLKTLTKQIEKSIRDTDILARFGGEEFIVLLPETDLKMAVSSAERICRIVEESPISFSGGTLNITVSIGASVINDKYNSTEEIIKGADLALYKAKESGRNRVSSIEEI